MRRFAVLLGGLAASALLVAAPGSAWLWDLPAGIAAPHVPQDNPMSAVKVELGHRLFYEADLSINGTMSCGTCHSQRHAFADNNRTRAGVYGDPGRRNVPGLANVAWATPLTWADPQLTTLEAQVQVPVMGEHPVEMGMSGKESDVASRLGKDACYVKMFRKAFPERAGTIDLSTVASALAAFQRTLISFDTPFDAYKRGKGALSAAAKRGAAIFQGNAACSSCHSGANLSDYEYHALNPAQSDDRGLGEKTGQASDDFRFRTPGLRNVALTAPYFHDGGSATLDDAIRRHESAAPASRLTDTDVEDMVAFLGALTDAHFVADQRFALPMKACGKRL